MHSISHLTDFEIKWRIPFTMIGFYVAESLREKGVKGIERQKNYKEILGKLQNGRTKTTS